MLAFAGTVLQPGGTVGVAAGAPLAEGVYFIRYVVLRRSHLDADELQVNLTQVVWRAFADIQADGNPAINPARTGA